MMLDTLFRTTDRILTVDPVGEAAFLVVDPSRWVYQTWVAAAESAAPLVKVFHAKSCAEAEAILLEAPCFHFSVNQDLPDGHGLDFFSNVKTTEPSAKAFYIGQTDLSPSEQENLGLLTVISPPLHRPIAEALLARFFQRSMSRPGLSGSLQVISMMDLVQLKCLQGRAAALRIQTQHNQGYLYFSNEGLIHVQTDQLTGREAFFEVMQWTEGHFEELAKARPDQITIHESWNNLLVEAAHRQDEARQEPS
jgi:hypothetical protein